MTGLSALRRLSAPPTPDAATQTASAPEERCEFCATDLGDRHGHVADVLDHRLLCVCRPCYLLFAPEGSGGGRYRGVGERVRRVEGLALTGRQWDALRIPVDLAFFFRQTLSDGSSGDEPRGLAGDHHLVAFYPGPGGATESLLDLEAWSELATSNPVLNALEPDIEAVLLRSDDDGFVCFLVPIDVCYELVGVVRTWWTGLGGGAEVWRHISDFFADLESRADSVPAGGQP